MPSSQATRRATVALALRPALTHGGATVPVHNEGELYCNSHEFIQPSSDSIEPDSLPLALRFAFCDPVSVAQTYTTRQSRFTVQSQIIDNS